MSLEIPNSFQPVTHSHRHTSMCDICLFISYLLLYLLFLFFPFHHLNSVLIQTFVLSVLIPEGRDAESHSLPLIQMAHAVTTVLQRYEQMILHGVAAA
jgi:hypothetical protein